MRVLALDHVNIAGSRGLIQECRDFYVDVLGLVEGYRPPFRSFGFWLYAGDRPVVHLSERDQRSTPEGPSLDHFAFTCQDVDDAISRLQKAAIPFQIDRVPAAKQVQIFLKDPAGVGLELNFSASE